MGGKRFKTRQLYQGSKDGFTAEAFHRLCDNKGPTIILMKLDDNNHCIGGFTAAQWKATEKGRNGRDPSAVVFNLTTATKFKVVLENEAIWNRKDKGPHFNEILYVDSEPFNGKDACVAFACRY